MTKNLRMVWLALVAVLLVPSGVAWGSTVDDLVPIKSSYVMVADTYTNNGKGTRTQGALFDNYHFLDVTGGSVAANKGSVDFADSTYANGAYLKYAEYGKHLNSLRLKNAQDVIAMKVVAGSKLTFIINGNAKSGVEARYPKLSASADLSNPLNEAPGSDYPTTGTGFVYEYTIENDMTLYAGSYNGDIFVSYIIVEVPEAEGAPQVSMGDQTFDNGLWYREITCTPAKVQGVDTDVYYTTDGTEPTTQSEKYAAPFKCYRDATIKFQAFINGEVVEGGTNEAIVKFLFNAPTITIDGANVTITSEYEGATNYYQLNQGDFVEGSSLKLDLSATITAYSVIQNGQHGTFLSDNASKDGFVLKPIKYTENTVGVTGTLAFDITENPYAENFEIIADPQYFFVKNPKAAAISNEDIQAPVGQEIYLKMNDTRISFYVDKGDSVDVVVTCSKNSCKNIESQTLSDRQCYVNVDGKNYGGADMGDTSIEGRNIIKFRLGGGLHTFQKYSGTGNIFISSIQVTPVVEYNQPAWAVTEEQKRALISNQLIEVTAPYGYTINRFEKEIEENVFVPWHADFDGYQFPYDMNIRVEDAPTAQQPLGTIRENCTPLIIEAKADAALTIYYRRQSTKEYDQDSMLTYVPNIANDGKDIRLVNQNKPIAILPSASYHYQLIDNGEYAYATKTWQLRAGNTYTLWARGTTGRLYGMDFAAGEAQQDTHEEWVRPVVNAKSIAKLEEQCYLDDSIKCNFTFDSLLVAYKGVRHTYLSNGERGFVLFGNSSVKTGDVISGSIEGVANLYHGTPQMLVDSTSFHVQVVSEHNTVPRKKVTAKELQADPKKYMNQYVELEGVTFDQSYTPKEYFRSLPFKADGYDFNLYNLYNRSWVILTDATYTMQGIFDVYGDQKQIAPLVNSDLNVSSINRTNTCTEVVAGKDSTWFVVKGVCTNIDNTTYGNWTLKDETGEIYIYGTLDANGNTKNFLSLGIEVGDTVTVVGSKKTYKTTIELVDVNVLQLSKKKVIKLGDVNNDDEIDVTDAVIIIDHILGLNPAIFNETAADANSDELIDIADVVTVTNMILDLALSRTDHPQEVTAGSLSMNGSEFLLDNKADYTAFQMDITVPAGTLIENAVFSGRASQTHMLGFNKLSENKYRIVGWSAQNDAFMGNTGDLFSLTLKNDNAQHAVLPLSVDNIVFVTVAGDRHQLQVNQATGISQLQAQGNSKVIYDLQGRRAVKTKKGLYIVNGKKNVIK